MTGRRVAAGILATALVTSGAVGAVLAGGGVYSEPVVLDEPAALDADIATMASEFRIPAIDVRSALAFQDDFSGFAEQVLARYPGQVAGVWVDPMPGRRGHIRFKTAVPEDFSALNDGNLDVTTSTGAFSVEDQHVRARIVFNALVAAGYRDVVTFYDQPRDVIAVELRLDDGTSRPKADELVAGVSAFVGTGADEALTTAPLADAKAADFAPSDISITYFGMPGPFVQTAADAFGGTWLLDDGVRECTGGFTVLEDGTNRTGVMSAGHCSGVNQYEPPANPPIAMTFMDQSWLEGGDVEWYTTVNLERDDFYRDANNLTDVGGLRVTNTMVNNTVCYYGRKSNLRTCDHTVQAVFVNVLADGNVPVGELARTTNNDAVKGDSGGPWFVSNIAWGITHGFDANGKSYFTTAQQANAQIAVHILTGGP